MRLALDLRSIKDSVCQTQWQKDNCLQYIRAAMLHIHATPTWGKLLRCSRGGFIFEVIAFTCNARWWSVSRCAAESAVCRSSAAIESERERRDARREKVPTTRAHLVDRGKKIEPTEVLIMPPRKTRRVQSFHGWLTYICADCKTRYF